MICQRNQVDSIFNASSSRVAAESLLNLGYIFLPIFNAIFKPARPFRFIYLRHPPCSPCPAEAIGFWIWGNHNLPEAMRGCH